MIGHWLERESADILQKYSHSVRVAGPVDLEMDGDVPKYSHTVWVAEPFHRSMRAELELETERVLARHSEAGWVVGPFDRSVSPGSYLADCLTCLANRTCLWQPRICMHSHLLDDQSSDCSRRASVAGYPDVGVA